MTHIKKNDFTYVTPQQYWQKYHIDSDGFKGLDEVIEAAKNNSRCHNCRKPVWKLGRTGLCFTCTTGETDKSEDLELWESSNDGSKEDM